MNRRYFLILAGLLLLFASLFGEDVDLMIGTAWPGNTTPAATWPMGMVQPGPDVGQAYPTSTSGYQFRPAWIMGFTQTHLSGTGCGDLQDFLLKPFAGDAALTAGTAADEAYAPGYYAVSLTNFGVRAEMTSTPRVALYRFTYDGGAAARVLVDLGAGPMARWRKESPAQRVTESMARVEPDGVFTAVNTVWAWADGRRVRGRRCWIAPKSRGTPMRGAYSRRRSIMRISSPIFSAMRMDAPG